jgi:putative ABC transport system permease protein
MLQDLRYAARSFVKAPLLTAVILVTLALGIGANTAIFSVIHAVLLRPSPLSDIEQLAIVWQTDRNTGTTREPASFPDYVDFKTRSRSFEALAALMADELNLAPDNPNRGEPVRLPVLRVSAEMLPMLGMRPVAGRTFSADEDRPGSAAVALISESLWERSFGRDPGAVGRTLRLDDRPTTIVGIMPHGADFGVLQILSAAAYSRGFADRGMQTEVDVWAPLQASEEALPRSTHPIFMLGRLAPGTTAAAAQSEMAGIAADLEKAFPVNVARGVHVEPLSSVVFGPVRPALYILLAAVALVLLVACVNVANLLMARAAARAHEAAVRCALGATQARIAREALAETLLLTVAASAVGVGLAYAGLRALVAIAPPDVPRLSLATINLPVLASTLGVAVLVGIVFGLIPTLQARRLDLHSSLSDGSPRGSAGPGRTQLRSALVVAELAFAVVLVSGAGLLIRSFWTLQRVNPGFQSAGVLKAEYQLPAARYPVDFRKWPDFKEQHAFNAAVLQRAAALPGVESAALAGNHPLDPGFTNSFVVIGREAEAQTWPEISIRRVSPEYFRTVGLGLVQGRFFRDSDTTAAPAVALINAAAARRFFPDREPIGGQIRFWGASRTIVGVIVDEKFHGLSEAPPIAAYTPIAQTPSANGAGVILVRTSGDPMALARAVAAAVHEVDRGLAVFGVEPMDVTLSRSIGQRRFTTLLLSLLATVALLLAAVGIHGVLSYSVSQRRREIGIRMALGARARDMIGLIVREGLRLALVGLALGLVGAFVLTRFLATQLFSVTPTDPATFAGVAALLTLVAVAATAIPARRAASVDPLVMLRSE